MASFERSVLVAAPCAVVFHHAFDPVARAEWDPFVAAEHAAALPAEGLPCFDVHARNGLRMRVQTISHVSGQVSAIRMINGPFFLRDFCGSWRFIALDEHRCRLRFHYHFHGQPQWAAPMIEAAFSRLFARATCRRLLGLKAFCEKRPFF